MRKKGNNLPPTVNKSLFPPEKAKPVTVHLYAANMWSKGGETVVFPGNKCEKSSCCHGKLISWVVQQNSMFYQKCWFGTHSTECLKVKLKSPAV